MDTKINFKPKDSPKIKDLITASYSPFIKKVESQRVTTKHSERSGMSDTSYSEDFIQNHQFDDNSPVKQSDMLRMYVDVNVRVILECF